MAAGLGNLGTWAEVRSLSYPDSRRQILEFTLLAVWATRSRYLGLGTQGTQADDGKSWNAGYLQLGYAIWVLGLRYPGLGTQADDGKSYWQLGWAIWVLGLRYPS